MTFVISPPPSNCTPFPVSILSIHYKNGLKQRFLAQNTVFWLKQLNGRRAPSPLNDKSKKYPIYGQHFVNPLFVRLT